ncbi:hypothetical protein [Paenibacillus sp. MMO-58]|uniref:hypothetical protein n=1 Tax=Paenibacillus sp. MMO-58 TaxID=3081290 RepID=UPI003019F6BA
MNLKRWIFVIVTSLLALFGIVCSYLKGFDVFVWMGLLILVLNVLIVVREYESKEIQPWIFDKE